MENDNYNTGGTGAALFAGKSADAANGQVQTHIISPNLTTVLKIFVCPSPYFFLTDISQTIGDEYKAPVGLPEWKQPSFDDDDRVDGAQQPFKPTVNDRNQTETMLTSLPGFLGRDPSHQERDARCQSILLPLLRSLWLPLPPAGRLLQGLILMSYILLNPTCSNSSLTNQGLGMDAAQCGFLIGVRPIVEYLATPFWHGISDRWLSPTFPPPLCQNYIFMF